MNDTAFFDNLKVCNESDSVFNHLTIGNIPNSQTAIINQLTTIKNTHNINISLTINRELFQKIDKLQRQLQRRSNEKISKSKVIAKICEQYLSNYDV